MVWFRPVEPGLAALAQRQGGHVHRDQLSALGLSRRAIEHRLASGYLIPVYRCVYAVGHLPGHPHDRARGAVLAVGPESALSHGSGACLWGAGREWRFPLELSSPLDRRPSGLIVHRNRNLTRRDITVHFGIRVTSPALTILDIAPRTSDQRLQRAIDDLRMPVRYLTLEQLEDTLRRFPRHRGARKVWRILGAATDEPTRSAWEQEWPAFAARHRLPPYEMNVLVGGHRIDVLFQAERLAVEMDGWEAHSSYHAFVADRARDAQLLAEHGISTVRITRLRFRQEPGQEARRLQAILARLWSAAGGGRRTA